MRAEIVSVGTELLLGQIVDTDAAYLSKLLPDLGIDMHYRVTVGDNTGRLADAIRQALGRADIVFTIGGLGPTQDDLTKETVAQVVGDEMVLHEEAAEHLRSFFASRGMDMPESNLKQAMIPVRGRVLENPLGTAPGAAFETEDGKVVIVLPGPPRELVPMVKERVIPYLKERIGENTCIIRSRMLKIAGIGESSVEDKVKRLLSSANPTVAPYASLGEVHLRITAKADSAAEADMLIDEMDRKVVGALGEKVVFGRNDDTLESVVVKSLVARGLTLAIAESCTGGLIANRITDVPGCSETFLAGVVSYSNNAKARLLEVCEQLISEHGAVSVEVAAAMAEGARRASGADIGVSTTGIAGPGGETPTKPVGLVYIALSNDEGTVTEKFQFAGTRMDIKQRASQAALDMLRMHLL
ncbi:MAG: competence/damage-inducible protein A [Armatimonadetes bacterium]|nr:competence/damage-inducible protein A [Armatimonadota bacterium]